MPRGGSSQGQSERDLLAERRARRLAESGESALIRRAEVAEATVRTLEAHVATLQRRLRDAESEGQRTTALAERVQHVEHALAAIRESHLRMATTVAELKTLAAQLRTTIESSSTSAPPSPAPTHAPASPRSEEMADALAAAVQRLRARAQAGRPAPSPARPAHKHSMSLIGRLRLRRKQRREGR
jgi:hypothetical protein